MADEEYTVGWVCALDCELTAARLMFDTPGHMDHDNEYYLGHIGCHNVVVGWLPAGQLGITAAAVLAERMSSKYKSLQLFLMVGVGGGVPSRGVRLGDVVVSEPNKGHGGVVQYDFGKTTPNGFMRTGHLNKPHEILLSAIRFVRSEHGTGRKRYLEYLSKSIHENPNMSRETAGPDNLFAADYEHTGEEDCEQCDKSKLEQRPPRENDDPEVHYGTIASGNQVMRYGTERDSVSDRLDGVLCFEMEAAGLMNRFQCLVIRGICDYADSHKNKSWQSYAALAAAAYAKELLKFISAVDVKRTQRIDSFDLPGRSHSPKWEPRPSIDSSVISTASSIQTGQIVSNGFFNQEAPETTCVNLHHACKAGDIARVQSILSKDPTIAQSRDTDGLTCLHHAVSINQKSTFEQILGILMDNGCELNITCNAGKTALYKATEMRKSFIVEVLVNYGADTMSKTRKRQIALRKAIEYGDATLIKLLFDQNARYDETIFENVPNNVKSLVKRLRNSRRQQ